MKKKIKKLADVLNIKEIKLLSKLLPKINLAKNKN